jgi:effector-binding domain-containing protein
MSLAPERLETREAQNVLVQRHTVPMAQVAQAMGQALPAVFGQCMAQGLQMAGPPMTRYPEMADGTCTLEAGIPVAGTVEAPEGFTVVQTAGGEVAVFLHKGGYDSLGQTWGQAFAWAKAQGRELSDAPWESYLTDPSQVPDPADWRTEIYLPLA